MFGPFAALLATTLASADFCSPCADLAASLACAVSPHEAGVQISEGKTRDLHPVYPSHIRPQVRMTSGFGGLRTLAHLAAASYALRVPRAGTLRTAFSRRFLAVAPLLFG